MEGEYIIRVDISSERSDQLTMIPLLENMESNLGVQYQDVTLDAGYESEENYTWFEAQNRICYIKPQNYECSKTRKFKSNMHLRENMPYDAKKDEYTCPNGKKLQAVYTGTISTNCTIKFSQTAPVRSYLKKMWLKMHKNE